MSLILDALRKSEAERRRGQVPDLHAELPPRAPATAAASRGWVWWLVGSLLVLAIAGAFAMRWRQREPGSVAAPLVARPAPPQPAPMARPITSEPIASAVQAPVPPPITATARPDPRLEPSPAAPGAQADIPTTSVPRSQPAAPPAPAPVALSVAAVPDPAPGVPAAQVDALPSTRPPAPGAALRLADLSPAEREQLPALKISMHMWGPTPSQRFAIIDGTRVGQGDRVGEAVVEEIVADGVVLSWHGRRLALPLR